MNKAIFLSIGLVVCIALAVQVNAGCLSDLFCSGANFDGLNKWLVKSLPDEQADAEANLAQVKSNMDKVGGSRVKQAADLFVEFMEAQQCNENLLTAAREMLAAGIKLDGLKRIERVMNSRLDFVIKSCGPFIDHKVEELYESSLKTSLERFVEVVVLDYNRWPKPIGVGLSPEPNNELELSQYLSERENRELDIVNVRWAIHLQELAKQDPKSVTREKKLNEVKGQFETIRYKDNYKFIYKKYLVEPCQLLTKTLSDTFLSMYALSKYKPAFVSRRSIAVKQLLYGFKQCEKLLSMDSFDVSVYFL